MYKTGDKPGKGKYKCTLCGKTIVLESDSDALPRCPTCGEDSWVKVE